MFNSDINFLRYQFKIFNIIRLARENNLQHINAMEHLRKQSIRLLDTRMHWQWHLKHSVSISIFPGFN